MLNPQDISVPDRWSLWCSVFPYIGPGSHFFLSHWHGCAELPLKREPLCCSERTSLGTNSHCPRQRRTTFPCLGDASQFLFGCNMVIPPGLDLCKSHGWRMNCSLRFLHNSQKGKMILSLLVSDLGLGRTCSCQVNKTKQWQGWVTPVTDSPRAYTDLLISLARSSLPWGPNVLTLGAMGAPCDSSLPPPTLNRTAQGLWDPHHRLP